MYFKEINKVEVVEEEIKNTLIVVCVCIEVVLNVKKKKDVVYLKS